MKLWIQVAGGVFLIVAGAMAGIAFLITAMTAK